MKPCVEYYDAKGRRHIGWTSKNVPASEPEQVTGWTFAPESLPNHKAGR